MLKPTETILKFNLQTPSHSIMTKVLKLKGFDCQDMNLINLYLLVLPAYKFGLLSGLTKCRALSGSKQFDILMAYSRKKFLKRKF